MNPPERRPQLRTPRFELSQRYANKVLVSLGRPKPPIPIMRYVQQMKWKIDYLPMFGPEGMALKFSIKGKTKFGILIASDLEGLTADQILRCQRWTLAHEIGHILLHGHYILNGSNFGEYGLDETTKGVLEVEAHWFASKLLMPDYIFQDAWDLDPRRLAEKCDVNLVPAKKRIDGLNPLFRRALEEILCEEDKQERRREHDHLMWSKYGRIWEKNDEVLDKLRRIYGYD